MVYIFREKENIQHFVKKPYPGFVDELIDNQEMYKKLSEDYEKLKKENEELKAKLEYKTKEVETPEYVLGKAIGTYIKQTTVNKSDVKNIAKGVVSNAINKHLNIEIEESWTPYSGQTRPDYVANVSWRE